MAKRIVLETVKVIRDGKAVVPAIGQPFDFTSAELEQINALRPQAVRKIINEDPEAAAAAEVKAEAAAAGKKAAAEKAAAQKPAKDEDAL